MALDSYTRLVFIGDSNSDNGNVLRMTQGTHPKPNTVYWRGRYSNGKTWTDILEEKSNKPALNLAHGCATIDNELVAGTAPMPNGRRAEIPSVLDQVAQLTVAKIDARDLVFIQVGSNDLNSVIDTGPTYNKKADFTPTVLAAKLRQVVEILCLHGAHHVVVMNVRPREDYPGVIALKNPQKLELSRSMTLELNAAIDREMAHLQGALGRDYRVVVFDTHSFQKQITSNPAAFGIDPDWRTPVYTPPSDSLLFGDEQHQQPQLISPDTKLFVDSAHLARRAQELLADQVINALALE
ncbi:hypothetical protein GGF37_000052 [Kickxella alabastrina]|nr:hypothetical protein GGF37_000052 [Kickxella alabastrina]